MPDTLLVGGMVLLYGDVGDPWGWGDGFTPEQVAQALAEHGPGPVTVRLNSGGGRAFDGLAIYSLLMSHDGAVTIQVDGVAASAASLIAMAGTLEMRQGAMLMIHDAAAVTFGNAAEHEKQADVLDKLSAQYAGVYARKCGRPVDHCRSLMQAETWLTADEAIAEGLADRLMEEVAEPTAKFDWDVYSHTPDRLKASLRKAPARKPVASLEKPPMPQPNLKPEDTTTDPAAAGGTQPQAKAWAVEFYALAGTKGLTLAETNEIVAAVPSLDTAKDRLIDALAARQAGNVPPAKGGHIEMGADARDKFVAGISNAFLAREGIETADPKNEFNGLKPMDLIREISARNNIRVGRDPMRMVAAVITHSSGDFSQITSNIAYKAMLKGYEEAAETFEVWTSTGSLPDFKQARRVDLNALPSLPQITEQNEYTYLSGGDRGEVYSISTAGGLVSISRQAIINDDLDVFGRLPRRLGRAAKRTIGNDVYGILASNPTMGDGLALFHATHANLFSGAGTALSSTSLQAGDLAMGLQKDRTQSKVVLGLAPKYLIVPRALKYTGAQVVRSASALGQANPAVINPVQNIVEDIVAEARLDAVSSTGWYLAADQAQTDTVEVLYLNGVKEPVIEEFTQPNVDGLVWKIRIDYGVKAFAWEGLQKQVGA
ncbi:Clp protease ClpP [Siculibacillus lacustris]|uniref:ATP-dependent Clp protease proteolytic subunit n=1 Tax=Siculibacillus lacustris TaxID=1549641 RepID=A0A4Q9VF45_9HYPH|nr:ClpP-like prohead protease/major capsid protein fusion protein [Siculibacillus lacustris]TBW33362.1 Clp protease ClpP [Siculibacillus lacustris]